MGKFEFERFISANIKETQKHNASWNDILGRAKQPKPVIFKIYVKSSSRMKQRDSSLENHKKNYKAETMLKTKRLQKKKTKYNNKEKPW